MGEQGVGGEERRVKVRSWRKSGGVRKERVNVYLGGGASRVRKDHDQPSAKKKET